MNLVNDMYRHSFASNGGDSTASCAWYIQPATILVLILYSTGMTAGYATFVSAMQRFGMKGHGYMKIGVGAPARPGGTCFAAGDSGSLLAHQLHRLDTLSSTAG